MKRGISTFVTMQVHDKNILRRVSIIHEQEVKGVKDLPVVPQGLSASSVADLTPISHLIESTMTSCTAKKAAGALSSFTTLNRREAMPKLVSHCFLNRKPPLFIDRAPVA
jgi:hypothetical protein